MLFSIVTPTRNNLPDLRRCVGSVRGHDAVAREHLIHDAVSSDGTREWLASQAGIDALSEPDAGMYDAINRGWARSKGDILSWLNSDEQYLPGTLARVQELFSSHPTVDALWGDAIVVSPSGVPIAARREIPLRRLYVVNGFLYSLSCTMFFRRRLLDNGLLAFSKTSRYAGDMELVLRLLEANVQFLHTPHYLSLFGFSGDNMCLRSEAESEAEAIRRKHGALPGRSLRRIVLAGRLIERFVRGSYASRDIAFLFATDEIPKYREVVASGIGGRLDSARVAVAG